MKKIRKNVNDFPKYKLINTIALSICLILIMSLSIGYAYLTQGLDVKGDITLRAIKDIRIMEIGNFTSTNKGYDIYNPTYTEDSISTKVSLPNIDSTVSYTVNIKNNGNVAMKVTKMSCVSLTNSVITYTLDGISTGDIIEPNTEKTFTVTYKYLDSVTTVPINTIAGNNIKFVFEEYIENKKYEYVSDNLLLDLRGEDAPINNIWIDRVNNEQMKLVGTVTYDAKKKEYVFENSNYATLGHSVIPETGDFTLEVRMTYPNDIAKNTDQAIIAQVSDTTNDAGRFKLNAKYDNTLKKIITFVNDTSANSNKTFEFTSSASDNESYIIQFERKDNKVSLYVNGQLVGTPSIYNVNAKISQGPFKIGYWNKSTPQYFHGNVNAVRVYDRALTTQELLNNVKTDNEKYGREEIITPDEPIELYKYATTVQLSDNGGSLYLDNTGRYAYRGDSPDNYLKITGSSDTYRIVNIESNGTMKILGTTKLNIAFDESGNRNISDSPYCKNSSLIADTSLNLFYGCNAWTASNNFTNGNLSGVVINDSTSLTYLNTTYYDSIDQSLKNKILTHDFAAGYVAEGTQKNTANTGSWNSVWNGKIGLLSAADVLNTSNSSITLQSAQTTITSYITAMSKSTEMFWTASASKENSWDVWTITKGNQLVKRRASRTYQTEGSTKYMFYALPTYYISANVVFTGKGTSADPFVIGE